jgi:uncharacterized membrane protein YidH (DUF202 family)
MIGCEHQVGRPPDIMSQHYKQLQHGGDAKRLLRERLQRQEIGDDAYEREVSYADNHAFKLFGAVFIVLFGVAVLVVAWLGYWDGKILGRCRTMSAGWVNLIALVSILLICTGAIAIFYFYMAGTRRGGRGKPGVAKPGKAHHREVNPKTGTLFP